MFEAFDAVTSLYVSFALCVKEYKILYLGIVFYYFDMYNTR